MNENQGLPCHFIARRKSVGVIKIKPIEGCGRSGIEPGPFQHSPDILLAVWVIFRQQVKEVGRESSNFDL